MKNQYFGDINDYVKYGLLRALGQRLTIAVVWMLTPNDASNDGRKTRYLHQLDFEQHDPELFAWLKRWYSAGAPRDVTLIEESGLLPNCRFFRDIVPHQSSARSAWYSRVRAFAAQADLVFLDADNGLQVRSVRAGTSGSSKYVATDEIQHLYGAGHSMLIYQHTSPVPRARLIDAKLAQLYRFTSPDRVTTFLSAGWIGFLLGQRDHLERIRAAEDNVRARWGRRIAVQVHRSSEERRDSTRMVTVTTAPGYVNRNRQIVISKTDIAGTDHGQRVYVLRCELCRYEYGANGSDIFQRRCPSCQNGATGLHYMS